MTYYVESRTGISLTILLKVRKILVFKVRYNSYYYNNLLISSIIRSNNYVSYTIYYVEYRSGTLFTIWLIITKIYSTGFIGFILQGLQDLFYNLQFTVFFSRSQMQFELGTSLINITLFTTILFLFLSVKN